MTEDQLIEAEAKEWSIDEEELAGSYVMLREAVLKPEFQTPLWRVFKAEGGFGCTPGLMGRAVFGEFVADGEKARYNRGQFERFATPAEVAAAQAFMEAK